MASESTTHRGEQLLKVFEDIDPLQELTHVRAALGLVMGKEAVKENMREDALVHELANVIVKATTGVVPKGGADTSKKSVGPGGVAFPQVNDFQVSAVGQGGNDAGNSKTVSTTGKKENGAGDSKADSTIGQEGNNVGNFLPMTAIDWKGRERYSEQVWGPRASSVHRRHVIFIGEIGAGKSSVINLFADRECAATSPDVSPCTRDFVSCDASVDGRVYKLWDTPGLNYSSGFGIKRQPTRIGTLKTFLQERYRRRELDLLVFCAPGSRATESISRTYQIFGRATRQFSIPVVIAITHLERTQPTMETWWQDNERSLGNLGLAFDGHACLTCLPTHNRWWASQQEIRFLISARYQRGPVSLASTREFLEGGGNRCVIC